MSGALPRMLTYICTLLVVLIAISPLMIVWPTILLAQIASSVPTNNATPPFAHIVVVVEENHSFSEWLWRSVKYEEVYLRAYDSVSDAHASLGHYLDFYNSRRPHSSLDVGRSPNPTRPQLKRMIYYYTC